MKHAMESGAAKPSRSASPSGRSRSWFLAPALGLLVGAVLVIIFARYLRSADVSPDSPYGYGFAVAGTLLLVAVGAGYTVRKRLRRNWSGLLHFALTWHIAGGALALLLILMHAAGNDHPRTGTYALYSLIALVVSGMIGRLLDSVAPRLAAKEALKTLTAAGEERIDALVVALDAHQRADQATQRPIRERHDAGMPWDLAYHDLEVAPDQIPALLNRRRAANGQHVADRSADIMAKDAMASESAQIRRAIGGERLFLSLVRIWRYIHTLLSVVTLALILWHLEFAATLLLNAR